MDLKTSLQDQFGSSGICFGCGPANARGLRIKSFAVADDANAEIVADFTPEPYHAAFENVLNGGIIGTLLDCHSNWTASFHLMKKNAMTEAPCTVTADFHVKLKRPTPMGPVHLSAKVVSSEADKAVVEATLTADGKVTATCTGTFVAVKPGHPAYHRW